MLRCHCYSIYVVVNKVMGYTMLFPNNKACILNSSLNIFSSV